jgi:PEGA domain
MTGRARSTPPWSRALRVAAAIALMGATGCVERRFIIETNVPNAQVYIDDQPVGAAPSSSQFEYYGYYKMTVVAPGYDTWEDRVHVVAPWYAYPPLDFAAEVLWPFHIHDTRRYFFPLKERPTTRENELIDNAEALRQRGYNLPIPAHPAEPKLPPASAAQPQPGVTLPPGGPQISPIVPPVGPQPAPVPPQTGQVVPLAGPQTNPLIPSVGPR